MLARREVDAALADFGAMAAAFRASFTPAGVKVEAVVDGSLFAKAGLRAGDVIATVEGGRCAPSTTWPRSTRALERSASSPHRWSGAASR